MKLHFTITISALSVLFVMVLSSTSAHAQDPHFSQFYAAPLQMNPALTGVFAGDYRFIANYRTQNYAVLGNQSYKSMAASFETKRSVGREDSYGLGLAILHDQVGESRFSQSRAVISGSYLKYLGQGTKRGSGQFLVGGAQLGVGQWRYDWENLWFSQQFFVDPANQQAFINYGSSNGEDLNLMETDIFLDFNAGLLYYYVIDRDNSLYLGGSLQHINQPVVSFLDDNSEKLYSRWVGQVGAEISLTREVSLLPAFAAMGQGPSFLGIGGLNLRYSNRDWREVAIRAGLWGRLTNELNQGMSFESTVVSAILEMERWQFGLNYDITVSGLSTANNSRGAFEISLIYVHPTKERFKVICPKF
ncbi:MAG: PorP/SprF family type IX secretion system membrane protein [Saprospiraceae bacterium]